MKSLSEECRNDFLNFIKSDDPNNIKFPLYHEETISKTTYNLYARDTKLVNIYFKYFFDYITSTLGKNFTLSNIWYQIYHSKSNSFHGYHNHNSELSNCNVSGVYYVKLNNPKLVTKFIVDGKEFQPDAKQGDLILFDSRIFHMSPENDTEHDKIIVAFNLDFGRYIF